ncbi:DUF4336 domain-containing protein [Ramlibacter tataouinensis]|nr:DUF4336 domain-containing protein [Ramlibacter tataouinensis]
MLIRLLVRGASSGTKRTTHCENRRARRTPGRTMGAALYEPIDVYKPVAANIGVVDGPFEYLTVAGVRLPLPFTTRMMVVRLSNGDLFLHSPTRFDRRLADELDHLGRIRHLISPNQFHYAHIGEWLRAYPHAVAWASPGVRSRSKARRVEITFARDLDLDPPDEWRNELDQTLFPGGYFKEFIFFHRESASLIVTDAIINLELDKMNEPWRTFTRISGMYYPRGQVFFGMRLPLMLHRKRAAAAISKLHGWRPRRILLSHGRSFDVDTDKVISRIFGRHAGR